MAIKFAIQENSNNRISASSYHSLEDFGVSSLILDENQELKENLEAAARAVSHEGASAVFCAHWAGDTKPVIAANQLAFLDDRLFGRLGLRVSDRAEAGLGHEAVWRRTDEYLTVLKRLWSNSKPIDH